MPRNFWFTCSFLLITGVMFYLIITGCSTKSSTTGSSPEIAEYVGEAQCQSCHASEHSDWKQSDHFRAMQLANDSTVLGDFNDAVLFSDGVTNRFFKNGNKFFVNTQGADGKNQDFEVLYTFGHFPLQQYLVAMPGGKMQSLRASWNSRDKKWFHQYAGKKIHHGDWLHWTGNSQNWNTMCASCHSTDLRKNYDVGSDSYQTTWKDINVGCESCHGPGSNHIEFMQTADYKNGQRLPKSGFVYSRDTISQLQMNTCAPCHARKTDIAATFAHSGEILDDLIPQVVTDEYFFADGQIKEEDYEYSSFAQSKMFHNKVKCSNCHNPHSGKLRLEGNKLCLSCHKADYDNPSHHFHASNTESSKCVNCHMPEKTFMGNDHRRDHSFRIPRPDQSQKYGTPNTCNSCHTNKSPQWAAAAIIKWYGPQRSYHFSDDLIPGSLRNDKSEKHLMKLVTDTTQPEIVRAAAVNYLGDIITPSSSNILLRMLEDKKALVRYHAIRALQNFPQQVWKQNAYSALSDKVRAVRIAAADLYHTIPSQELPEAVKTAFREADAENRAFLNYQSDFPVGNVMLADFELQGGDYANAIKNYLRGLKKDSLMNYARLNLSAAYNSAGQNAAALKTLQDAAKIDPSNDRIYYNLGLLCYEMNDMISAESHFQKAAKLGSPNPSLYYNYGLLLQRQGKLTDAEKVFLAGYSKDPQAENINYALAVFYLQQNNTQQARKHAAILYQINPRHPDYQQIFSAMKQ